MDFCRGAEGKSIIRIFLTLFVFITITRSHGRFGTKEFTCPPPAPPPPEPLRKTYRKVLFTRYPCWGVGWGWKRALLDLSAQLQTNARVDPEGSSGCRSDARSPAFSCFVVGCAFAFFRLGETRADSRPMRGGTAPQNNGLKWDVRDSDRR